MKIISLKFSNLSKNVKSLTKGLIEILFELPDQLRRLYLHDQAHCVLGIDDAVVSPINVTDNITHDFFQQTESFIIPQSTRCYFCLTQSGYDATVHDVPALNEGLVTCISDILIIEDEVQSEVGELVRTDPHGDGQSIAFGCRIAADAQFQAFGQLGEAVRRGRHSVRGKEGTR